jgi:hypothetical protein
LGGYLGGYLRGYLGGYLRGYIQSPEGDAVNKGSLFYIHCG